LLLYLGYVFKNKGDNEQAINVLTRSIDDAPTSRSCLYTLYTLHAAKNDHVKMIPVFERAVKENPHDGWLWLMLGDIYKILGQLDQAHAAYDKAVDIYETIREKQPNLSRYELVNLSNVFNGKGDVKQAIATLEMVVEVFETEIETDPRNEFVNQVSDIVHPRFRCQDCRMFIHGYRFLCTVCPHLNISCKGCVLKGKHLDHEMVSIPTKTWVLKRFPNTEPQ
jgi:tetratricopeptide (TPR) repeat protein